MVTIFLPGEGLQVHTKLSCEKFRALERDGLVHFWRDYDEASKRIEKPSPRYEKPAPLPSGDPAVSSKRLVGRWAGEQTRG